MERALFSIAVLGSTACLRAGNFHCATDSDCFRGDVVGVCEPVGYCSFPDPSCSVGQRFGDQSGSYAGQCVAGGGGADAGLDSRPDSAFPADAPAQVVQLVSHSGLATGVGSAVGFPVTIPNVTKRFLLVSVQIGSTCGDASVPAVGTISFNQVALTQVTSIVGTPCDLAATRTEHWGLVSPDVGQFQLDVSLTGGTAQRLSITTYAFAGVNQVSPVRLSRTAEGSSAQVSVTVPSVVGDLVLDTVGASTSILPPAAGQHEVYIDNAGAAVTLGNDAASTQPGSATVTPTWTLSTSGEWQTIASSLQP
jgi:hypothetical protein